MALLNLAAQLKQSLEQVKKFDFHPLQEASEVDQLNYLKALSLMIYADDHKDSDEEAYFGALVRTLIPGGGAPIESLLSFAENPDFEQMAAIKETVARQEQYGIAFLMDLAMLAAADFTVVEEELAVVAACRGLLGWDRALYNHWYACCATVAVANLGEELKACLRALPTCCTAHVLQHRCIKPPVAGTEWAAWNKESARESCSGAVGLAPWDQNLLAAPAGSRAARIRAALEAVAVFPSHPLLEAGLEDKINYLKALSLVMAADGNIEPGEKAYFGAATRTLVGAEMFEGLLDFAREPDLSEVAAMMDTMAKSEVWQMALVLDSVALAAADGDVHQDEESLIQELRKLIKWDHRRFKSFERYATSLVREPEGLVLDALFFSQPASLVGHIMAYRGIHITKKPNLASQLGMSFEEIGYLSYGEVINGDRIIDTPVSVAQIVPFLDYLQCLYVLQESEGILKLDNGGEFLDLGSNGLSFREGAFSLDKSSKDRPVSGISPLFAQSFCMYMTALEENEFEIPAISFHGEQIRSFLGKNYDHPSIFVKHGKSVKLIKLKKHFSSYITEAKKVDINSIYPGSLLFIVEKEVKKNCKINLDLELHRGRLMALLCKRFG